MARPIKLTPERVKAVLETLGMGATRDAAAARAGISVRTLYEWMHRGEEASSGKFREFFIGVRRAEQDSLLTIMTSVRIHAVGGWHKQPRLTRKGRIKRDPETGEPLMYDVYAPPNLEAAVFLLERRDPENWAPPAKEPPPKKPRGRGKRRRGGA